MVRRKKKSRLAAAEFLAVLIVTAVVFTKGLSAALAWRGYKAVGGFVGEVVSAAILCGFVERADMDNPKADAPATPTTASPLVNMLRDAFLRAANNKTAPAADKPAEAADAPEVVEWLSSATASR